jgi:hypothetical protein
MWKKMCQVIRGFIGLVRCFAEADDKLAVVGDLRGGAAMQGALNLAGLCGTNKFTNICAQFDFPWNDSISGPHRPVILFSRTAPSSDADWGACPLGSMMCVVTFTAKVATAATWYMLTATNTWTEMT